MFASSSSKFSKEKIKIDPRQFPPFLKKKNDSAFLSKILPAASFVLLLILEMEAFFDAQTL